MSESRDTECEPSDHPGDVRRIVSDPAGNEAGVAITRHYDPGPHQTKYTIDQLWPDGTAEPLYLGDEGDVLHLIQALSEVLRRP